MRVLRGCPGAGTIHRSCCPSRGMPGRRALARLLVATIVATTASAAPPRRGRRRRPRATAPERPHARRAPPRGHGDARRRGLVPFNKQARAPRTSFGKRRDESRSARSRPTARRSGSTASATSSSASTTIARARANTSASPSPSPRSTCSRWIIRGPKLSYLPFVLREVGVDARSTKCKAAGTFRCTSATLLLCRFSQNASGDAAPQKRPRTKRP